MILASIILASEEDYQKLSARVALCSLVWPLALVWLVLWVVCRLFVIAEWVPKKREDKGRVHLYDPSQRPIEGGMSRVHNTIEVKPMTAIPKPPKKR